MIFHNSALFYWQKQCKLTILCFSSSVIRTDPIRNLFFLFNFISSCSALRRALHDEQHKYPEQKQAECYSNGLTAQESKINMHRYNYDLCKVGFHDKWLPLMQTHLQHSTHSKVSAHFWEKTGNSDRNMGYVCAVVRPSSFLLLLKRLKLY